MGVPSSRLLWPMFAKAPVTKNGKVEETPACDLQKKIEIAPLSRINILTLQLCQLGVIHHHLLSLCRPMDLVLQICDDYAFDRMWAYLVPLPVSSGSSQTTVQVAGGLASSKWANLLSYLPRPQIPTNISLSSVLTSSTSPPMSAWPRDYIPRQLLSLIILTLIGIHVLYFLFAWLSYRFIFNHNMMRHPRFLKNQVKLEIQTSLRSFPGMTMLTLPWFQAEVMGYSKLYASVDDYGWTYLLASIPL